MEPSVLIPKLVPAAMLAVVSAPKTSGYLTTPNTSPTMPPTNPISKPAIAYAKRRAIPSNSILNTEY
jgi:hypothetical protein